MKVMTQHKQQDSTGSQKTSPQHSRMLNTAELQIKLLRSYISMNFSYFLKEQLTQQWTVVDLFESKTIP